jgi:hypothetical protein
MLRNRVRNQNESKSRLTFVVIASIIGVVLGTSACGTQNGANDHARVTLPRPAHWNSPPVNSLVT